MEMGGYTFSIEKTQQESKHGKFLVRSRTPQHDKMTAIASQVPLLAILFYDLGPFAHPISSSCQ
jgi:hypothetical protein